MLSVLNFGVGQLVKTFFTCVTLLFVLIWSLSPLHLFLNDRGKRKDGYFHIMILWLTSFFSFLLIFFLPKQLELFFFCLFGFDLNFEKLICSTCQVALMPVYREWLVGRAGKLFKSTCNLYISDCLLYYNYYSFWL